MKLKVEYIPIEKLTPYENNAKIHTEEQVEQIAESIQAFGMNDPVAVWGEDNLIIEGHGRLLACQKLGIKEIPIIRLDDLTDEQRRAYTLVHNQTTMTTGFDLELLNSELERISFDMTKFGFEDMSDEDFDVDINETEIPDIPKEAKSQRGEIYQLGEHRLMVGDSTIAEDVQRLMNGKLADLVVTDPPYNVGLGQNKSRPIRPSEAKQLHRRTDGLIIENDEWEDDAEFVSFLVKAFGNFKSVLKDGGAFYIWHASNTSGSFLTACEEVGLTIRQTLIWVKNAFALGRQDYQWKHEPCLYGWNDGAGHYFVYDRTLPTVFDDDIDFDSLTKEQAVKLLKDITEWAEPTSVLREDKPNRSELYPTMKPVPLIARLIYNSSKKGELVLDLFGGSGTTLIASEELGRVCYMMEYDPLYADVIIERYETITGKKAVKLNV